MNPNFNLGLNIVLGAGALVMLYVHFFGKGGEATSSETKGWGHILSKFGGLGLAGAMVINIVTGGNVIGTFILNLIMALFSLIFGINTTPPA